MAQYAVLIYAGDSGASAGHDKHADDLAGGGAMVAAYALTPRAMARAVRGGGVVTDGPFLETKEIVAGFYILEAPDLDTACAIAATNPAVHQGGGVEVRPIHSGGPV